MTLSRKTAKNEALPKGWRRVKLGEFGTFYKGKGITKADLVECGVPCLRYAEIYTKYDGIVNELSSFVSPDAATKATPIQSGDIIFAASGETAAEIGKAIAFVGRCPAVAGGDTVIFRDHGQEPAYLAHVLNSADAARQKARLGKGQSVVHIHVPELFQVEVPLPPLHEQRKIAEILATWDTAIEKTEALIAAKEKQFKWLLKTLISDQQDNPEWRRMMLGDICTFEYGKPLKEQDRIGNQYPVFGSNGVIGSNNKYLVVGPFIVIGRKGSAGTVLYSMSSGFPIDTTFYINLQSKEVHLRFLYYLLLLVELDKISAQSGVPGLNRNDAYKISMSMPSFVEQREIARVLDVADCETSLLKQLAEQYRTQRRGLMQKLLTGKWRIQMEASKQ